MRNHLMGWEVRVRNHLMGWDVRVRNHLMGWKGEGEKSFNGVGGEGEKSFKGLAIADYHTVKTQKLTEWQKHSGLMVFIYHSFSCLETILIGGRFSGIRVDAVTKLIALPA